jgi:succinate dehydrogenase / fumarate reductase cytochrome b subunit
MAASIAHRVTGVGLATVGTALFTWWLAALASGPAAYASFQQAVYLQPWTGWEIVLNALRLIFPVGLTFAFFLHMSNGLRHFVMDMGAGYELKTNKTGALIVLIAPFFLTAIFWLIVVETML